MPEVRAAVGHHQRHRLAGRHRRGENAVITLSVGVRRFTGEEPDCPQQLRRRFEGIDRGGASHRALRFFADLSRDLGGPEHHLRVAVGAQRHRAHERRRGRLGPHLAIDECSVRKHFVYATVFSDPARGVVIDMAPGRNGAAVLFVAGLYCHAEPAAVRVVSIDCHAPYRAVARVVFPHALIVADTMT